MTANARDRSNRENADVVGTWVTADGHIRQELLPDGRYDEARGIGAARTRAATR